MATTIAPADEILEVWKSYKADQSQQDLRNRLVERYLPLVKYNGERIWSRLPEGVELDDLISAGIFGLNHAGASVRGITLYVPADSLDAAREALDLEEE